MVSTAVRRRGQTSRHTPVTEQTPLHSPADQCYFGYLYLIRAAAFNRHVRACTLCTATLNGAGDGTPCPRGLALAELADYAESQHQIISAPPRPAAQAAATLW